MREQARLSQAVFARYVKLTIGYVSQRERGTKRPTGPALVLLNVIRRKGIEAILSTPPPFHSSVGRARSAAQVRSRSLRPCQFSA